MKVFAPRFLQPALFGAILSLAAPLHAQTTATTSDTVQQAFAVARTAVPAPLQTKVVSVYGLGSPTAIGKWYIIFYDPKVPSHGRAVLVSGNKIIKTYEARATDSHGRLIVYYQRLAFDPAHITSEQPALTAAQNYATRHQITYDTVRALLKQTQIGKPFRWRIELVDSGKSRGFVMVNAIDDSFSEYSKPAPKPTSSEDTGGGFAHDVQKTFLGIGGDLEEFFTGERTVDK